MVYILNPKVAPLGKDKVEKNMLQKEADCKATIKLMKQSLPFVCLTTDGWTSLAQESYTALTGHYIDDWKLQKVTFGCFPKEGRSTAEHHLADIEVILLQLNKKYFVFSSKE